MNSIIRTPLELQKIANQLRIHSIRATTAAGSGHPTSCCSAADLVAALFFGHMRYDSQDPRNLANDRFVLSKGHAAPLLYAAWAETGHLPVAALTELRQLNSPLEGHPTPRLDFVDVATGSLGQGLAAGVGMALRARMDEMGCRTYVLLGDGESSEGSVWEAASLAGVRGLGNLVAIFDVNRLGQSQATAFGHHLEIYRTRLEAFGWKVQVVDGHDFDEIQDALRLVGDDPERPYAIVAKTLKGKGIPFAEDREGWHGKVLSEEQAREVIALLSVEAQSAIGLPIAVPDPAPIRSFPVRATLPISPYRKGEMVAARMAFGKALARIGEIDTRVMVLDGDVENSTYTENFSRKFPDRFIECYISEQNMVGVATGLAAMGKIPVVSTFAAFFSRAMDQIRMASISRANLKVVGTHAGVSIGEDGPSQMGLEDLAAFRATQGCIVLCPCDAVSTERLVEKMIETTGIVYLRAARPEVPVLYECTENFEIGGAKILKQPARARITLVAAGITVFEALKAFEELEKAGIPVAVVDAYSIKPLARELLLATARQAGNQMITVEDHYADGGLGDAVAGELSCEGIRIHKLAVRDLPHSGRKEELLRQYGIDARAIVDKVREVLQSTASSLAA